MTYKFDRLSPGRQAAIETVSAGTWEGTKDIVSALIYGSRGNLMGWTPMRQAGVHVLHANEGPFITADEFAIFKLQARAIRRIRKLPLHPGDDIGLSKTLYLRLSSKAYVAKNPIAKVTALACAHYTMGYPVPCAPEDMKPWFQARFGTLRGAAEAMGMSWEYVQDRVNGYRIDDGVKRTVLFTRTEIRALDWIWRNGPSSPYGEKPFKIWPGQEHGTAPVPVTREPKP